MPEIILTFEWDGKTVKKETKGFTGPSCVEKTKFLEDALGKASNRRKKSDYYEEKEKNREEDRLRNRD